MGAWGPAIFSDDLACDIRDSYRQLIEDGVDDDEAADRILEQYADATSDFDDGPVFWIAFAVTQSKVGRLRPEVKQRALDVIESGQNLERWDAGSLRRRRAQALEKAKELLEGPQPAPKRLRPPFRHVTSLKAGDVLAATLAGHVVLLRVARIDDNRYSVAPILVVLDFNGSTLPTERKMARLKDRRPAGVRRRRATGLFPKWYTTTYRVTAHRKVDFADAGFRIVGSIPSRPGDETWQAWSHCGWEILARELAFNLS